MTSEPLTVADAYRCEIEPIKGSRFVGAIAPVETDDQAKALLEAVRQAYPDASHHCSAWRVASPAIERASDDGEPSGSAGRPILAQLSGPNVVDAVVVVSRWFGGTKLGVGGLVRAYGGAAAALLESAQLVAWIPTTTVDFQHGYPLIEAIDRAVTDHGGTIVARTFDVRVACTVQLPLHATTEFSLVLANLSSGDIVVDRGSPD